MHQFIKNVEIGDTYLIPSGVFTQIQLRFYWEKVESTVEPRTEEQITADNAEIGRQLMEAIWQKEAAIKQASIEEKEPQDHSG